MYQVIVGEMLMLGTKYMDIHDTAYRRMHTTTYRTYTHIIHVYVGGMDDDVDVDLDMDFD